MQRLFVGLKLTLPSPHLFKPYHALHRHFSINYVKSRFIARSIEDISNFDEKVREKLSPEIPTYLLTHQYVGSGVKLEYNNQGTLVKATSENNVDWTEQVLQRCKDVSKSIKIDDIPGLDDGFVIHGAIVIRNDELERINKLRVKMKMEKLVNAQFAAQGLLVAKNDDFNAEIRFIAVWLKKLLQNEITKQETLSQRLTQLQKMGFTVDPERVVVDSDMKKIQKYIIDAASKQTSFETIGILISVDSLAHQEKLGYTHNIPAWCIQYRFPEKTSTICRILDIDYTVDKTGLLRPYAIFQPVTIKNRVITRAPLISVKQMINKKITIGDLVRLEQYPNDVAPRVVERLPRLFTEESKEDAIPLHCPCSRRLPVEIGEDGEYYCNNEDCSERLVSQLEHWCLKLNIKYLRRTTLRTLVTRGFVKSICDLYTLHEKANQLKSRADWGQQRVNNILTQIEESKRNPFPVVLSGLGVINASLPTALHIVRAFPNIDALLNAQIEDFYNIPQVEKKLGEKLYTFFHDEKNIEMIKRLQQLGLQFSMSEKPSKPTPKVSRPYKVYYIQGKFQAKTGYTRAQIKEKIQSHGGKFKSTLIPGKIDYFVVGEGVDPEMIQKAKSHNAQIIEINKLDEFLQSL